MTTIKHLITKYGLILAFSSLIGQFWFYLSFLIFPVNSENYNELWRTLPNYINYAVQVLVCILLIVDIRKYKIKFRLLPVLGLFYPLLGISAFLILYILKTTDSTANKE